MLFEKIESDTKIAMKERDEIKLSTLRMLKAAIKNDEIAKRKDIRDDADVIDIIRRLIKQHRDSIDSFKKGNRDDLVNKEQAESKVLEAYLPTQMPEGEIELIVKQSIEEVGSNLRKDMGQIMKIVMENVKGKADGKTVSQIINKYLQ